MHPFLDNEALLKFIYTNLAAIFESFSIYPRVVAEA